MNNKLFSRNLFKQTTRRRLHEEEKEMNESQLRSMNTLNDNESVYSIYDTHSTIHGQRYRQPEMIRMSSGIIDGLRGKIGVNTKTLLNLNSNSNTAMSSCLRTADRILDQSTPHTKASIAHKVFDSSMTSTPAISIPFTPTSTQQ